MDTTILVDKDIQDGRKLVEALDRSMLEVFTTLCGGKLVEGMDRSMLDVVGALWFYFADIGEWRLLLVMPLVDTIGPSGCYAMIQLILQEDMPDNSGISLSRISVLSPKDNLIKLLRMVIHTDRGISAIRFTRNTINGVSIEDALIYRLSDEPKRETVRLGS
jgi:hypothetical protein